MKNKIFKNAIDGEIKKIKYDKMINFALLILLLNIWMYSIYGGTFSFTLISLLFLSTTILMKVIGKSYIVPKIVNYMQLILICVGISILIIVFLFHPNYTVKNVREIAIKDIKTKVTDTIKVENVYKTKKISYKNYFVRYDYVVRLEYNEECYEYIIDPISGKYSINTFSLKPTKAEF